MTIQQDIEKLLVCARASINSMKEQNIDKYTSCVIHSDVILIYKRIEELAELLLKLSNIKPTALYPSSANDEEEDKSVTGMTFLEAVEDGKKARRPVWCKDEYVWFNYRDDGFASLRDQNGEIGDVCQQDYYATDWEHYKETKEVPREKTYMTFYQAIKSGEKIRQNAWNPDEYIMATRNGDLVDEYGNEFTPDDDHYSQKTWEYYEETKESLGKTSELNFFQSIKRGDKVRKKEWPAHAYVTINDKGKLVSENGVDVGFMRKAFYDCDWEPYAEEKKESEDGPVPTMDGHEAARLVMEGKTVERLSTGIYYSRDFYSPFRLVPRLLEAKDFVEVK